MTFFGTNNCENLPFGVGNDAFGCPTNGPGWVRLGSRRVGGIGGSGWIKTSIDVTPNEDIFAMAIGPDCPAVPADRSIYYFFDNLVLADIRSFEFRIDAVGHPCSSDFALEVPLEENLNYQWYRNGIALIGENDSRLSRLPEEGHYQVVISDSGTCSRTKEYEHSVPVAFSQVDDYSCLGESYWFGNRNLERNGLYIDTFINRNQCDSIVHLNLEIIGLTADSVSAKIFPGETYQIGPYAFDSRGTYEAEIMSSLGCDSLVLLDLDYYNVYIPNAFSPNDDGRNDLFFLDGGLDLMSIEQVTIFDRWGIAIYDELRPEESGEWGWDGTHQGKSVNNGIYAYRIRIRMDDGIVRTRTGSFLLIR